METWNRIGEPFTTDEGATFTPVIHSLTRAVGYTVEAEGMPLRVVFLNPSGSQDDSELLSTDLFVYVEDTAIADDTTDKSFFIQVWDDKQDAGYHARRQARGFE